MKDQPRTVYHHFIHQAVCKGTFCTDPEFNKNTENLEALITYIELLKPSLETMENSLKLIKFYRLPIILTFRNLYQKLTKLESEKIQKLTDQIKQVAARVTSILELTGIKMFEEIKYIFKWEKSQKKFKFGVSEEEKEFAEFIYLLSHQKKKIIDSLQRGEENSSELLTKLDDMNLKRPATIFEKYAIQYIKESAIEEVEQMKEEVLEKQKLLEVENEEISTEKIVKTKSKYVKKDKISQDSQLRSELFFQKEQKQRKEQHYTSKNLNEHGQVVRQQEQRQLPMCCRRFFRKEEVLDQPETLKIQYKYYNYPFKDRPDQKPGKVQKIKRTICGFLNAEGGIIFFGIKQNSETKKREASGYIMSQKIKINFRNTIFDYLKDIKPDASAKCMIKWVPIKSAQTEQFLHGRYIPKVIIEKGAKQNLYSYVHENKIQKFAFKTQNQFLTITQAQKILKMYHNKLKYPERVVYSLHEHPCKEPFLGKPVYQQHKIQSFYDPYDDEGDFPSLYQKKPKKEDYKQAPTKKFREKGQSEYLVMGITKESLWKQFQKKPEKLGGIQELENTVILVTILDPISAKELRSIASEVIPVYSRVKFQTEKELLKDIIKEIESNESMAIKQRREGLFCFKDNESAVRFWLKVKNFDYDAVFTPDT